MVYVKVFFIWLSNFCGLLFQQPYSKAWDEKLNKLLDNPKDIKIEGKCTVRFGDITVWVGNKYYSYGHPYSCRRPEVRPSIKTMIRLSKVLDEAYFK